MLALAMIVLGLWRLESSRTGLSIERLASTDGPPVWLYQQADAAAETAPIVVIAHGFAGSRQLMDAYALTLARAGYRVLSFDFLGHGRNRTPLSGALAEVAGATQRLLAETEQVIALARGMDGAETGIALLGHSMATDILARAALRAPSVKAVVGVAVYSDAITATGPDNLLILNGAWEPRLHPHALRYLRQIDPEAEMGQTVRDPANGLMRRAVIAPSVEHVGILYSPTALAETVAWLDATFARASPPGAVQATGPWIVLLLTGIVLLAGPLATLLAAALPGATGPARFSPLRLKAGGFTAVMLISALGAVTLAGGLTYGLNDLLGMRLLPVLVADYLLAHLAIQGLLALILAKRFSGALAWRDLIGPAPVVPALLLVAYGLGVFGVALDRYGSSFMTTPERAPIIAVLALGAVPLMLADAVLTEGGRAPLWRRLTLRLVFFASLAAAVAINPGKLFFLAIAFPVIVLFFIAYGWMGRSVALAARAPAAAGLGLGLCLAWALGVTFPYFVLQ